jgi:exonuclease VII large subunit
MLKLLQNALKDSSHRLQILSQRLEMNNPDRLLELGYAFVSTKEGEVISSVKLVSLEAEITISMKDGVLSGFITGKKLHNI